MKINSNLEVLALKFEYKINYTFNFINYFIFYLIYNMLRKNLILSIDIIGNMFAEIYFYKLNYL